MRKQFIGLNTKAQTAVEYMLLLAAVVSIVLVGFKNFLPSFHATSNYYFNQVAIGVLGEPSRCGDGTCSEFEDCEKCPSDCPVCSSSLPSSLLCAEEGELCSEGGELEDCCNGLTCFDEFGEGEGECINEE